MDLPSRQRATVVAVAGLPPYRFTLVARSGYLYSAAVLLWLVAAALCSDERSRLRSWFRPGIVAPVLAAMILGNMIQFSGAARGMRMLHAEQIAYLRLLEALRGSPDLDQEVDAMLRISARKYFTAIDRFGVPRLASGEPALSDLGRSGRQHLDQALGRLVGRASARRPPDVSRAPRPM